MSDEFFTKAKLAWEQLNQYLNKLNSSKIYLKQFYIFLNLYQRPSLERKVILEREKQS